MIIFSRLFSLTHVISDDENRLMYHRLDRLSATYTNEIITVRAGRQAQTWGNGLVFNPMDALQDGNLQTRMARGDLFTLGRWYATGQIQFEAHPLINMFLSAIVNLNAPSMLLQPRITWDVLSSTRILSGLDIPVGAGGTEYGGPVHAPTGKHMGAPLKGYIIATWYF
jgi:hypothetical protein